MTSAFLFCICIAPLYIALMLIYNTIHRADFFHFHIVFILFSVHYHKNGSERVHFLSEP